MNTPFQCEIISLETVYRLAHQLGLTIKQAEFEPDIIIAIARGGFVPARLLCDFLQLHNLASIKVQHYMPGADKKEGAVVKYPLNTDIKNLKVLLVDDVNDTGKSLLAAVQHLQMHEPKIIKTAVLHEKEVTSLNADFVAKHIKEWRWIIYQWAVIEDVGNFIKKMNSTSAADILSTLEEQYGINLAHHELNSILPFITPAIKIVQ